MNYLAAQTRPHLLRELANRRFDLAVIGGGITGAGIALDAASRGLQVALIEKDDFGAGTSSKSTKLIHGGLRYLKQFEIQLVREVGRERATVHRLAPHLVLPEKMLLPLIKGGTYGPWATSIGLKVYDILAGVKGNDRRRMLSAKKTAQKEPLLRTGDLIGGGYYAEYRTDDARLTIENIKTANEHGALCANYVKAGGFFYQEGKVAGIKCVDQMEGTAFDIHCDYVISAAGPWVDHLRKKDNSLQGKHLFLSKGVHIVVPFEKLPLKQSVYFDNTDGRMVFAIPRNRSTYIGTTDTPYEGDVDRVPTNLEDVNYLLAAANQMFPEVNLQVEDVESSWAGLRPLIFEEGKSASEMSRKDEIFESETGLISIAGGKLTGYRKMAERVVDVLGKRMQSEKGRSLKACRTKSIPLAGGAFSQSGEVERFRQEIAQSVTKLRLPDYYANYLVFNYGIKAKDILDDITNSHQPDNQELSLLLAELRFTLDQEGICCAEDFFNRRTGRLYFNLPSVLQYKDQVLQALQQELNWDQERLGREQRTLEEAIALVTTFPPEVVETEKVS